MNERSTNSYNCYMARLCLVISLFAFLLPHLLISGVVLSANVTLLNGCNYTVWPGVLTGAGNIEVPTNTTKLQKGENITYNVPSSWSGRFYGRTQCVEDSFGNFTCLTGDCGSGKLECSGSRSIAAATLAEFTISGSSGRDFFDISLIQGYNMPIKIVPIGGNSCTSNSTECTMNVNDACPSVLKVSSDEEGVACNSACTAFGDPQYCCTGMYNSPENCKATDYSKVFKYVCPAAYSYPYDDKTSTFTCADGNYLIAFCSTAKESNDTRKSGGVCGNGTASGADPSCLDKPGQGNSTNAFGPGKSNMALVLKIGPAVGGAVFMLFLLLLFLIRRRIKTRHNSSSYPKDVEAFIRKYGPTIPKRFTYSTVKRITNSFKEELGRGGYGNVYKGELSDGCVVAVKILKATEGNGEEFMNEVASIGRTSHVNVVSLLGFVYEGKKRALIYEFMPNGSLDKFIHGTSPSLEGQCLTWEKLYGIALGIARGLEYLHCGCTTQILHFDIKPHNILLDEDFCPKISDFGLAKLYTRKESVLSSIMQARGTIGYIAPEVISKSFGQVSHKSDVYSYGMMILEMVGGRKNVDNRVAHTSEIYFPRWVYKHIHDNEETISTDNVAEEENHIVRKMMIVGLWCIQTNPSQRPSISKVIEMFEGHLAALEIPPKPYMCSPPTSPSNSQQKILSRFSSLSESNSSELAPIK